MDMDMAKNRRITVAEMAPHVHKFQPNENKVDKIVNWLSNWINLSLDCGKIEPYDFLPTKGDLAFHIGVSLGTMQNVFRKIEDLGYIESKQKIGSYIKNRKKEGKINKLTSKRELAIEVVKKYISENNYQKGDKLISSRKISEYTGIPPTTIQLAIKNLVEQDILTKKENSFFINQVAYKITPLKMKTLVEKTAEEIKNYVSKNFQVGEKIPSNKELTKIFGVSIKTIHDSIKLLNKEGFVFSRRGKYGTIYINSENNVFSNELYKYEKIEQKLRLYIFENCKSGDKLPSIKDFAAEYKTSEKTIKKALDNLLEDGFIAFSRGRYGGTFVLDIPQNPNEAYKWLAISSDYMQN